MLRLGQTMWTGSEQNSCHIELSHSLTHSLTHSPTHKDSVLSMGMYRESKTPTLPVWLKDAHIFRCSHTSVVFPVYMQLTYVGTVRTTNHLCPFSLRLLRVSVANKSTSASTRNRTHALLFTL